MLRSHWEACLDPTMKRAQILLDLRCMMRAAIISRVLVPTCFPLSDSFFFFPRRRL